MPQAIFDFNSSWRFIEGLEENTEEMDFDDSAWRIVDLPHDWSIEHDFSPDAPAYCRGAWLPAGKASYRKRFRLPTGIEGRSVSVYFDGVYRNATVFLNGHKVAFRPWGYIAFECDLTPFINYKEDNILTVKVDNSKQPGARWYAGSGIYRSVKLFIRDAIHIPTWGVQVSSSEISGTSALVRIQTNLKNTLPKRAELIMISSILDGNGKELASQKKTHVIGAGLLVNIEDALKLDSPKLWSLKNPHLYTLRQELQYHDQLIDMLETRFGIREMKYDAQTGFSLNGENIKIKGVCLHNDGGALGAACSKRTFERQLKILKEMGCNAVRTAHHPFSEIFLDACDEAGILVLAEAFDEWQEPISVAPYSDGEPQRLNVHYYSEIFDQWASRDLSDMILRDRNHPSIFMWSIGNEVPQMYKPSGRHIAERLQEIIHNLDSRPVTCAVVTGRISDENIGVLDVAGYNYPSPEMLDDQKKKFPGRLMIVTEHYSAQTRIPRGDYYPKGAEPKLQYRHPNASKFIREHKMMSPGIKAWQAVAERPFVMGTFIWTGWDYLGEITPYDWPAHASSFGVIDLCGFPKDGYYYYRSQWRDDPLVQLCTHWNWALGTMIEVKAISNCDSVELFLNGRTQGKRESKDALLWDIPFEQGELKALTWRKGLPPVECVVRTAGSPKRLKLSHCSESKITSGGDLAYVTCELLDADGNPVPLADNHVSFTLEGPALLRALDNGDPFDTSPFQGTCSRQAFHGKCMAILATDKKAGRISVSAHSDGLLSDTIVIESKSAQA